MNDFDEDNGKLLAGFNFATHADQMVAVETLLRLGQVQRDRGAGPFPLVVIHGPEGCGKTTLVQRMTQHVPHTMTVSGLCDLERGMQLAVKDGMMALVVEEMPAKLLRKKLPLLREYAAANMWEVRKLREDPRELGKCLLTIVITSEKLPVELGQGAPVDVVRLRARKEGGV